jgi:hypothetical protein
LCIEDQNPIEKDEILQPLAYTTAKISWTLLLSAILRARNSSGDVNHIDLNMETLPSIVLSCIALEAFVNEVSSLSNAFLFDFEQECKIQNLEADKQESIVGVSWSKCEETAKIKNDSKGSFYERYKILLKILGIENPPFLQKISDLENVRNGLVHFKMLDIPIVSNSEGIIVYAQKSPEVFNHLKRYSIKGSPVIAADGKDGSIEWTLRISTNAMAIWCVDLILDAIIYTLDTIPNGKFKDFIFKAYMTNDKSFVHVFQKGKSEVELWANNLYSQ